MTRIDGLNPLQTSRLGQNAGAEATGVDGDRERGTERAGRGNDEVRVSPRGRVVAEVIQAVHESDDVRAEKVAALKAAIANGTYTSNAREIAARLLASGTFGVE